MVQSIAAKMARNFPRDEEFVDHSGNRRRFHISLYRRPEKDFFIEARELSRDEGYYFKVYSEAYSAPALGSALGRLRKKIKKELATRYLYVDSQGRQDVTHNAIRGRISDDGLIVDGVLLPFAELERILTTHEGFMIHITINDPSE
jgi:hypothetical protein